LLERFLSRSRMKIAILNQPQDPMAAGSEQRGSVAIVNWELARCLARRHEVIVYAPRARGQRGIERCGDIEIRRIRFVARRLHQAAQLIAGRLGHPYFTSRFYYREYFSQIARDLAARRPDIVHLPNQMQFAARLKRAAHGARIVVHMHQEELAKLDTELLRRDLTHVDAIATVSDFVTSGARARLPEMAMRIHTIGNGVDVLRFRPADRLDRKRARHRDRTAAALRLLYVGRIAPDKGVHLLVEAVDRLTREGVRLELTLIGKAGLMPYDLLSRLLRGDQRALDAVRGFYGDSLRSWLAKEVLGQHRSYILALRSRLSREAAARVRFRGTVPLTALVRAYRAADLLVLPSIWQESYGLPVAEAMACGVPVLASASGGVPELIEDGVTGRLVPRLECEALTRALRELAAQPARLREMGRAARARAERLLTWSRSAERLERLYIGLLAEPADARHPVLTPASAPPADIA
jgi:glycosyltransferase involved in cell wall biosynthesis